MINSINISFHTKRILHSLLSILIAFSIVISGLHFTGTSPVKAATNRTLFYDEDFLSPNISASSNVTFQNTPYSSSWGSTVGVRVWDFYDSLNSSNRANGNQYTPTPWQLRTAYGKGYGNYAFNDGLMIYNGVGGPGGTSLFYGTGPATSFKISFEVYGQDIVGSGQALAGFRYSGANGHILNYHIVLDQTIMKTGHWDDTTGTSPMTGNSYGSYTKQSWYTITMHYTGGTSLNVCRGSYCQSVSLPSSITGLQGLYMTCQNWQTDTTSKCWAAFRNVRLAYPVIGYVTSKAIQPSSGFGYGIFSANFYENMDGSVKFDILNANSGAVIAANVASGYNLSNISSSIPIKLRANFSRSWFNVFTPPPSLYSWTVSEIDNKAPVSTISKSPTGWTNGNVTVTVSATDNFSGVAHNYCRLSGGSYLDGGSGNCVLTASNNTTVEYYASDAAGATSSLQTYTITNIDKTAPNITGVTVSESHGIQNNSITNLSAPSFSWNAATDTGGSGLAGYGIDWGTTGSYQSNNIFNPTLTTSGLYSLQIRAKDNAGNYSGWVLKFSYKFDNTPPSKPSNIVENHGVVNGSPQGVVQTPTFQWGESSDNFSLLQYRVYFGSSNVNIPAINSLPIISKTNRIFSPTNLPLENQPYYFIVYAEDEAHNFSVGSDMFTFTYSGEGEVTKYYGLGPVTAMSQDGEYFTLVSDQVSSTALVVDADGDVVSETRYYPFGEVRYTSGNSPTDKTYTGQRSEDFGLMDYNARYYSPLLGRFASADTIVPEPGNLLAWDRYAYVYNSPIGNTDPTGHFTDDALYDYLLKLNKGDEEQAGRTLALWKVNKDWMDLLHDAEGGASLNEMIGDMLFVSSNGENGNMSVTGTQMYGVGQDYLEGLSGGNNLVDLFNGMQGAGTVRPNLGSESEIRNVFGNLHIRNHEYTTANWLINTITWGGLIGAIDFYTAPLIPIKTVSQAVLFGISGGALEAAMWFTAPESGDTVITATSLDQSHSYQYNFVWSNNVELNYYDLQRYKLINWSNFK